MVFVINSQLTRVSNEYFMRYIIYDSITETTFDGGTVLLLPIWSSDANIESSELWNTSRIKITY